MPKGFLAYITPVDTDAHPSHPIAPGGPPPVIWPPPGGPVYPTHPIVLPPGPVDPGYGVPAPPTQIWGGKPGPWGGSWVPPQPGDGPPPEPGHPIVIPPDGLEPGVPTHPIYIPVFPAHPIVLPPEGTPPDEKPPEPPPFDVKVGWTAETGWIVVLVPTGPHPAPSR